MKQLYRRGNPIYVPTSTAEYIGVIFSLAQALHDGRHTGRHAPKPVVAPLAIYDCPAERCRMACALVTSAYRCPEAWHQRYQGTSTRCPRCHNDWVVTDAASWASTEPMPSWLRDGVELARSIEA